LFEWDEGGAVDVRNDISASGGGIMKGFWDAVVGEGGKRSPSPSPSVQPFKATGGSGEDWCIGLEGCVSDGFEVS
jgi:hypothetical protein